ncbi:hypothetical protein BR93DRAFT_754816 [Coniochaeta sp. PMI_546]|nr:hypothetical protein BR93DRAFT_754816 [Coniochaeta sp. PMI_546]
MATAGDGDKGPWSAETKAKFESKHRSEWLDPCQEAAERSIRCLNRNGGDRKLCTDYFQSKSAGLSAGRKENSSSCRRPNPRSSSLSTQQRAQQEVKPMTAAERDTRVPALMQHIILYGGLASSGDAGRCAVTRTYTPQKTRLKPRTVEMLIFHPGSGAGRARGDCVLRYWHKLRSICGHYGDVSWNVPMIRFTLVHLGECRTHGPHAQHDPIW